MSGDLPYLSTEDLLTELASRLSTHLAEPIASRVVEMIQSDGAEAAHDPWLDSAEAAAYLGVGRDTLRKQAAAGLISSEQDGPGCKRYFRRSALDQWRESGGRFGRLREIS